MNHGCPNVEQASKRRVEIDYVKGFAIIMLICSHCIAKENVAKTWISAFNMPIFFIICGCLKRKSESYSLNMDNVKRYLIKRSRQLLIPYLVFGVLMICFYQVLKYLSGQELTVVEQFYKLVTFQGIDSMWFIPCYFIAEFAFAFFWLNSEDKYKLIIIASGIALVVFINALVMPQTWFSRIILKAFIGLIFICIGYIIEQHNLINICKGIPGVILFLLASLSSLKNGFIGIGALELKHVGLFYMNATIISICLLSIFQSIVQMENTEKKILKEFGQKSIVVLCTNNLFIEIIRLLDYKITGNFLINHGMAGNIVFALIIISIEWFMIMISRSKVGVLFGFNNR